MTPGRNFLGIPGTAHLRRIIPLGQTSSIAFPFSRLDREPFWKLVPQPGKTITPAIINNTSSVSYLRKYALGAKLDEALFRVMQGGEGREGCCLDLADREDYTPRNVPDFLQE